MPPLHHQPSSSPTPDAPLIFFGPNTPCSTKTPAEPGILVGLPNGESMKGTHTCLLPFNELPLKAWLATIFPAIKNLSLLSIGQICDSGYTAVLNSTTITFSKQGKPQIGHRDKTNGGLYIIYISRSNQSPSPTTLQAANTYNLRTKKELTIPPPLLVQPCPQHVDQGNQSRVFYNMARP